MPQSGKIPATVITGFLGAGKTSLIRHLMENANGRRIALVINEFGDVGIDGDILKACGVEGCGEDDIVELANGCICCTVADEFLPTMEALLERPEPPEHIVIETSGLALPKPLVKAFTWPEVRTRVTVDGVIAVIDGAAVAEGRFAADPVAVDEQRRADPSLDHESPLEELFEDQLACADLVVVNKADLLDSEAETRVRDLVDSGTRPAVKVVPATFGRLEPAVVLGLGAEAEDDLASRPSHHDDEDGDHDHDDFVAFHMPIDPVPDVDWLTSRLETAIEVHDILRVKGFVAVDGKDMRLLVQGVGNRVSHYYDRPWESDEHRGGMLVVIGFRDLDRQAVMATLDVRNDP